MCIHLNSVILLGAITASFVLYPDEATANSILNVDAASVVSTGTHTFFDMHWLIAIPPMLSIVARCLLTALVRLYLFTLAVSALAATGYWLRWRTANLTFQRINQLLDTEHCPEQEDSSAIYRLIETNQTRSHFPRIGMRKRPRLPDRR